MTQELAMYFLSGVLFVVCCLIGAVYKDNKEKLQEHTLDKSKRRLILKD